MDPPSVQEGGGDEGEGGGGEETALLRSLEAEAEELEVAHRATLGEIDELLIGLRESETELLQLVVQRGEEEEGGAALGAEGERVAAVRRAEVLGLRDELAAVEAELAAAAAEERAAQGELEETVRREQRILRRVEGDEALLGGHDHIDTLGSREAHLRCLEDDMLDADAAAAAARTALEKLRREHAMLRDVAGKTCATADEELAEARKIADVLARTYDKLQTRLHTARAKAGGVQQLATHHERRHENLEMERDRLEQQLRRAEEGRAVTLADLDAYAEQILGAPGSDQRLLKLEDTMMRLKAAAINLGSDLSFVKQVLEAYPEAGKAWDGFVAGYSYVRTYVVDTQGPQREDAAWIFSSQREPTYDEVEPLFTALKQMVVCYDMMPIPRRRDLALSREVIRNGGHLTSLALCCSSKYVEVLIERKRRESLRQQDREERIRRAIAPKLTIRSSGVLKNCGSTGLRKSVTAEGEGISTNASPGR